MVVLAITSAPGRRYGKGTLECEFQARQGDMSKKISEKENQFFLIIPKIHMSRLKQDILWITRHFRVFVGLFVLFV